MKRWWRAIVNLLTIASTLALAATLAIWVYARQPRRAPFYGVDECRAVFLWSDESNLIYYAEVLDGRLRIWRFNPQAENAKRLRTNYPMPAPPKEETFGFASQRTWVSWSDEDGSEVNVEVMTWVIRIWWLAALFSSLPGYKLWRRIVRSRHELSPAPEIPNQVAAVGPSRAMRDVAAIISLLLSVAVAVLWSRSRIGDAAIIDFASMRLGTMLLHGTCEFYFGLHIPTNNMLRFTRYCPNYSGGGDDDAYWDGKVRTFVKRGGFAFRWGRTNDRTERWGCIQFPDWFLIANFAGIPAAALLYRTHQRRRRLANGQCMSCGYDLRASTDRCPECGTPIIAGNKR